MSRCAAVELDTVPLCEVCEIETFGERQEHVLEQGLETLSRFDGGLTRDRLSILSEERHESKIAPVRAPRRLTGATGIETELKRFINASSSGSGGHSISFISGWLLLQADGKKLSQSELTERSFLMQNAADMGTSEDLRLRQTPYSQRP
jgi:hypothetical protein